MLERDVEKKLKNAVKAAGGLCWKFTSPGIAGVPDRICLFPGGVIAFVELKAPGKAERPLQQAVQRKISGLGFAVFPGVDGIEKIQNVVCWATKQGTKLHQAECMEREENEDG